MQKQYCIYRSILFLIAFFCLLTQRSVSAAIYPMPSDGSDIVGKIFTVKVQPYDSSTTIRQRYEVSYNELISANPHLNFNQLHIGDTVVIPAQHILPKYREGIVVNATELRIYYFSEDGRFIYTFPIGLGRADWRTPITVTAVTRKQARPTWYVPDSIRDYMYERHGKILPDAVPPGPNNPLGGYALYLAKRGYLIHGTDIPDSVGTFASSGCMRLSANAIETLYQQIPIGTPVHIIHHEAKAGWLKNVLYLEVHPPIAGYNSNSDLTHEDAEEAINNAIISRPAYINWGAVEEVKNGHLGIPAPIGTSARW